MNNGNMESLRNGSEELHDGFRQTELTNNRSCVHVISSDWLPLARIFPI